MIPKSGNGFSEKIMRRNNLERVAIPREAILL
jgi:hypothetical protein